MHLMDKALQTEISKFSKRMCQQVQTPVIVWNLSPLHSFVGNNWGWKMNEIKGVNCKNYLLDFYINNRSCFLVACKRPLWRVFSNTQHHCLRNYSRPMLRIQTNWTNYLITRDILNKRLQCRANNTENHKGW